MASEIYTAILKAMRGRLISPSDSTAVAREKLNALHHHPVDASTRVEWTQIGGVRCASIEAPSARSKPEARATSGADVTEADAPTLLLCHGGAYIAACGDGYLFYGEMLSRATGLRVVLVDYRLAPEHPYPAALDDCLEVYAAVTASVSDPRRIGLIGDSCGGALALATLLRARDAGLAMPGCAVALGGWFDHEATSASARAATGGDPFAHRDFTRARARDYVGVTGDLRDPYVSPLYADLAGFPPLLLQVGELDLTRDEAFELAAKAGASGVDATVEVHPEMVHGFQGLAHAGVPEAVAALDRVSDFLARNLRY